MKIYHIGRLPNNDIRYTNKEVSRQHADITCMDNGSILLTDHSSNGTLINGRLIQNHTTVLNYGDNVVFGGVAQLDWSRIDCQNEEDYDDSRPNEKNGMAVAGFILSFFASVLGLIFSIIGIVRSKNLANRKGHGLALAGIIISSVGIFICIIVWAYILGQM